MATFTTVIVLCLLASWCHGQHDDQLDKTDAAMDTFTWRMVKQCEKLTNLMSDRETAEETGYDLNKRLNRCFGNGCDRDSMFRCGVTAECVHNLLVCDGSADCRNGADEKHCEPKSSKELALEALYKRVSQLTSKLDLIEMGETASSDYHKLMDKKYGNGCPENKAYRCGYSAQCVSKLQLCDGSRDCGNGADELSCENPIKPGDKYIGECGESTCGRVRVPSFMYEDTWEFTSVEKKSRYPNEQVMKWKYLYPGKITGEGEASLYLGTGTITSSYVTKDGISFNDHCDFHRNGDILRCDVYLYNLGQPCSTCYYRKK